MERLLKFSSSFLLEALGGFGLLWLALKIDLNAMPVLGYMMLILTLIIFITLAQLFIKKVIVPEDVRKEIYYVTFITPLFLIFFGALLLFL